MAVAARRRTDRGHRRGAGRVPRAGERCVGGGSGGRRMRILVVSLVCPWPEDAGARMRAGQTVKALSALGEVDLYVLANAERIEEARAAPADVRVRRIRAVPRPRPSRVRQRLAWGSPGGPPRMFAAWDGVLHDDLVRWAD